MSEFNLNTLEGQVEHILKQEQAKDKSKGMLPMSEAALAVFRENLYTAFKERSPEYMQKQYGLPAIQIERDSNYSNSAKQKPDFSQNLIPPGNLPPTTSFRELLQPYYGDQTDQEMQKAFSYADQNFPAVGQLGASENVPSSFSEKFYRNFTPENAARQIPIVPTYNDKQPTYDSMSDSIFAGRGLLDLVQPLGNAMYENGISSRIDEPKDLNNPATFADPAAMVPEMASAQRQHFKNTGSRMSPEILDSYMNTGDFQQFQPPTQKALHHLQQQRNNQDPAQQKQYQDLLKILPSLVMQSLGNKNYV